MNLNSFAAKFQQYLLPISLIALVIIFMTIGITNLGIGSPKENQTTTTSSLADLEFTTANLASPQVLYSVGFTPDKLQDFPTSLATYTAKFGLDDNKISEVAQKLSLNPTPQKQAEKVKFTQKGKSLIYDTETLQLSYMASLGNAAAGINFNEEELKQVVIDFISRLSIFPQQIHINKIEYYTGGLEPSVTTAQKASLVTVYFQITVDGYPTLKQNYLSFDSNRNLIDFRFFPFQLGEKKESYPLKNYRDLATDLSQRQVKITSLGGFELQLGNDQVNAVGFTNLSLIYIDQPGQLLLQPGYLLTGETAVGGSQAPVEAVVAAVKGVGIKP